MAVPVNVTPPMVVLRPGDRVLIALEGEPPEEEIRQITAALQDSFPGVDFTVLDGVQSICVAGGE